MLRPGQESTLLQRQDCRDARMSERVQTLGSIKIPSVGGLRENPADLSIAHVDRGMDIFAEMATTFLN